MDPGRICGSPRLGGRFQLWSIHHYGSGLSFDGTESGIEYTFNLDFDSLYAGVDIYPLKGKFRVSLGATGPIASDPGFIADLETERAELQQSLDDLDLYPYAMLGFVVRF